MELLYSESWTQEDSINHQALRVFDDQVIDYLNELSKTLLKKPQARLYPDVATFAFFCRKSNISKIKEKYKEDDLRLGRGMVFHVGPSNVPVNFAYSLVAGLLTGNVNFVKVPSKDYEQINIIANAIKEVAKNEAFKSVAERIVLIKYPRNEKSSTDYLSKNCDVRVIWGGDETINNIRKSQMPSKAYDITFADRYSLCAIQAEKYLKYENKLNVAEGFFNDTYLFDQNACTAPHLVYWVGEDESIIEEAQQVFWANISKILDQKKYEIESIIAVDKLTALYSHAIASKNLPVKHDSEDNLIWRIEVEKLFSNIEEFRSKKGYFVEYSSENLNDLSQIVNQKYQTLSYFGFAKEDLEAVYLHLLPIGIDRIVPIGQTMDFELTWDGYNLINSLSRVCSVR